MRGADGPAVFVCCVAQPRLVHGGEEGVLLRLTAPVSSAEVSSE